MALLRTTKTIIASVRRQHASSSSVTDVALNKMLDRNSACWCETTNARSSMVLSIAGQRARADDEWFESAVRTFNSCHASAGDAVKSSRS